MRARRTTWVPAANVSEGTDVYTIKLAVPGLDRHCFRIHCSGNELTVFGKKDDRIEVCAKETCEYNFSEWKRSFVLPQDADTTMAQAIYKNGELIISLPRNNASLAVGESDVYIY
jgi:HSP20 family protein